VLLLTGCRSSPFNNYAVIDWVDFIKWDGQEYDGISEGELADINYIDKKIGEVKFKVDENIHDPEYKIKDGDAAFYEKGTAIYTIKGNPDLIAVKSTRALNGYDVFYSRDTQYKWHFKDMPLNQVNHIDIFLQDSYGGKKRITSITAPDQVKHFLQLLQSSKENPDFQPHTDNGDPAYYQMVLYTGEPIAYKYDLQYDGQTYFWHPWNTSILSNDIQVYINQK
jgi:hypothetical protein